MNSSHQVLLVEDDPIIARTLAMSLRFEGFVLTVAPTAAEATRMLSERRFDLVMFDVGLPDGSGIELCRSLRRRDAAVPVLMLSARTDEETAVAGIESGADDYIRKPYGLQELVARMRRLLSRRQAEREVAAFAGISMDAGQRTAFACGRPLQLGKKEFDILLQLVRAQGDTVARERMLAHFDDVGEIYDRTIDSHLSHLRRKLKDAAAEARITAVYGIGYRLEAS